MKKGQKCDWCNKDAVYEWVDDGETNYACTDHKGCKHGGGWR